VDSGGGELGSLDSFYHTFVRERRGRNQPEASLLVLDSILASGLLLVPEEIRVPLVPGIAASERDRLILRQLRLSLTMLDLGQNLDDLRRHAALFGPITVELQHEALRSAGVLPVLYFPSPTVGTPGASDLGFRILADLYSIGRLVAKYAQVCPDETADVPRLLATLRGLASAFYPADTLQVMDRDRGAWSDVLSHDLRYFRQREWRLIGGLAWDGGEVCSPLSEHERQRLREIDAEFFCDPAKGFDGRPKIEYCRLVRCLGTRSVRDCIASVFATEAAMPGCKEVLARYELSDKLRPL